MKEWVFKQQFIRMTDFQAPYKTHRIRIYILIRSPCDLYPHWESSCYYTLGWPPDPGCQVSQSQITSKLYPKLLLIPQNTVQKSSSV